MPLLLQELNCETGIPNAEIEILTAESDELIGGQLASWSENGFPIEHGLHALFGFYTSAIPYVHRVGAFKNLTRSKDFLLVHEHGKLLRFNPRTWFASYRGFTPRQRLSLARFLPKVAEMVARVNLQGFDILDNYDHYDFRAFCVAHGLDKDITQSNFFRQFYDGAFNEPHELSAAVGLKSLFRIFSKPWMYYFNTPTREAIVNPFKRYFESECKGVIHYNRKVTRLNMHPNGKSVSSLEILNPTTGEVSLQKGDAYIIAVGLEQFKEIDFGEIARSHEYFQNINKLETVSSISLQAWFKNDPFPKDLQTLIVGLPEPFSIACPMSRVRSVQPPSKFSHELAAVGPEAGFENVSDKELVTRFFKTLTDCGFSFPTDEAEMYVHVRRNRDPFHRYLLTRPNELHLRPRTQSPIENLVLAGAWIRNSLPLPCVDSAAESGRAAALATVENIRELGKKSGPTLAVSEYPIGNPLVLPPPYTYEKCIARVFLANSRTEATAPHLPTCLKLAPGFESKLLLVFADQLGVRGGHDPIQAVYNYYEVMFAAVVEEVDAKGHVGFGVFPLVLYVDNDVAVAAGREVFGFPKRMAEISHGNGGCTIARSGVAPDDNKGALSRIEIAKASWTSRKSAGVKTLFDGAVNLTLESLLTLPFYLNHRVPAHVSESASGTALARVLRLPVSDFKLHSVAMLENAVCTLAPSQTDPIVEFLPAGAASLTARFGVEVTFQFAMKDATVVDTEHQRTVDSRPKAQKTHKMRRSGLSPMALFALGLRASRLPLSKLTARKKRKDS